jgi:hypothetical protein
LGGFKRLVFVYENMTDTLVIAGNTILINLFLVFIRSVYFVVSNIMCTIVLIAPSFLICVGDLKSAFDINRYAVLLKFYYVSKLEEHREIYIFIYQ